MREIKFRAWDKYKEQMIPNVETGAYQDPDEIIDLGTVLGLNRFDAMQYTGLKDKNGKEIYEGDVAICRSYTGEHNAVIKFGEYQQDGSGGEYLGSVCIGFYAEAINKNATDDWGIRKVMKYEETASLYDFREIEVIGNIYEHPHLLGE